MAAISGNTLTGSLSTETPISGNITVGTVNITGIGNGYTKGEVDDLLEGKSDVGHTHSYNELSDLPDLSNLEIDTSNLATKEELNNKADKNHNHDITWNGGETVDLQTAFDYAVNAINNKASTTYVDDAINTALNGIESQLDEIIGEEV